MQFKLLFKLGNLPKLYIVNREGEIAAELSGVLTGAHFGKWESNSCREPTVLLTESVFQHLLAVSRNSPTWKR